MKRFPSQASDHLAVNLVDELVAKCFSSCGSLPVRDIVTGTTSETMQ